MGPFAQLCGQTLHCADSGSGMDARKWSGPRVPLRELNLVRPSCGGDGPIRTALMPDIAPR
eukprot:10768287-Alexandrium_andersonii.AAC.1